jgi:ATP-binding cassette subfamily B protein
MSLLHYFGQRRGRLALVIAIIVVNAGLLTLGGIGSATALTVIVKRQAGPFFAWVGVTIAADLSYAVLLYFQTVQKTELTQEIDTLIRADVAQRLGAQDYAGFHHETTATYTSWLTNDINTINEYGIGDLLMIIQQIAEIIFSGTTLFFFHWSLLVTVLVFAAAMVIFPRVFKAWMDRTSLARTKANERLVNVLEDMLNGFDTLFMTNLTKVLAEKIVAASRDVNHHYITFGRASGAMYASTNGLSFLSQLLLLAQAGWLILRRLTPVGAISGVQYFGGTIFAELSGIAFNWREFRSVGPIMDKLASAGDKPVPGTPADPWPARPTVLQLTDVTYGYADRPEKVLRHVSLTIPVGRKLILTGDSGTGKSTLLGIISGQITQYTGDITLSGQNYRDLPQGALHDQLAYVTQEPYIFNASFTWNITLGRSVPTAELTQVLQQVGLTPFVDGLAQGLDTILTHNGTDLSGGQKQRIALARALVSGRPILLLDEATSALDKDASLALEKSLLTMPGLTILMVTHHLRPEIAALADQVVALNDINQ